MSPTPESDAIRRGPCTAAGPPPRDNVAPGAAEPPVDDSPPTDDELDGFVAEWRRHAPPALRRLLEARAT